MAETRMALNLSWVMPVGMWMRKGQTYRHRNRKLGSEEQRVLREASEGWKHSEFILYIWIETVVLCTELKKEASLLYPSEHDTELADLVRGPCMCIVWGLDPLWGGSCDLHSMLTQSAFVLGQWKVLTSLRMLL